jgi:hypothetical protein
LFSLLDFVFSLFLQSGTCCPSVFVLIWKFIFCLKITFLFGHQNQRDGRTEVTDDQVVILSKRKRECYPKRRVATFSIVTFRKFEVKNICGTKKTTRYLAHW